jgi:hypothetical protein
VKGAMLPGKKTFGCSECTNFVPICPKCTVGFQMEKTGPFGDFYGCSNWRPPGTGPSCSFKKKIIRPQQH